MDDPSGTNVKGPLEGYDDFLFLSIFILDSLAWLVHQRRLSVHDLSSTASAGVNR